MLYNFYIGHSASVLSKMLGRSVSDFEPESYNLSEIEDPDSSGFYSRKDKDGNLFRLGFYLTHYNTVFWDKSPALHIDFCDNAIELKHRMKATNTQMVTYYSKDNKTVYKNRRLSICKKCLKLLRNKTSIIVTGRSFEEFILTLEEDDTLKCTVANKDGYVINWQQISKAFRETKNYECERCFYKLNDLQFSKFIQTHHINAFDKSNNKRSNLKCLCVKCHSEVDDYHRKQFTSIENQLLLAEFEAHKTRP
jgi:chemotaxis protein CheY-P-specific phosphatase CheC